MDGVAFAECIKSARKLATESAAPSDLKDSARAFLRRLFNNYGYGEDEQEEGEPAEA